MSLLEKHHQSRALKSGWFKKLRGVCLIALIALMRATSRLSTSSGSISSGHRLLEERSNHANFLHRSRCFYFLRHGGRDINLSIGVLLLPQEIICDGRFLIVEILSGGLSLLGRGLMVENIVNGFLDGTFFVSPEGTTFTHDGVLVTSQELRFVFFG